MATQINVTVDRGGLLERNKQQTNANRQARQEQDTNRTTEATAQQQRTDRLDAEGLNADGTSKAGRNRSGQRPDQDLAAFRRAVTTLYLGPSYEPIFVPESGADPEFIGKTYHLTDTGRLKGPGAAPSSVQPSRSYLVSFDFEGGVPASSRIVSGPTENTALELFSSGQNPGGVASYITEPPEQQRVGFLDSVQATLQGYLKISHSSGEPFVNLTNQRDTFFELQIDSSASKFIYKDNQDEYITEPLAISTDDFIDWTHFAVTYSLGVYRIFVGGTSAGVYSTPLQGKQTFQLPDVSYGLFAGFQVGGEISVLLSSLQVVNKALYQGSFTPPLVIR